MSINCKNCNTSNREDSIFCYNCGVKIESNSVDENNGVIKSCKAGKGFNKGELHLYSDRIEFIGKKGIEKIYYSNLEKVKKSLGTLCLDTIDNECICFDLDDNVDEWVKLIKERIFYHKNKNYDCEENTLENDESEEIKYKYKKIKKFLKEKDNKVHVVMINNKNRFSYEKLECADKYTNEVDYILSSMQEDGYEIIDVKFHVLKDSYGLSEIDYYRTLITYK